MTGNNNSYSVRRRMKESTIVKGEGKGKAAERADQLV